MTSNILKVARHRNGVCGVPFTVAIFHDQTGTKMLGIRFDDDSQCYTCAFDLEKLAADVIEFGENSFRGDHYEPVMKEAEKKWAKQYDRQIM